MECPKCNSTNFVKFGTRNTKYETIKRYQCKDCGKDFDEFTGLKPDYNLLINKYINLYPEIAENYKPTAMAKLIIEKEKLTISIDALRKRIVSIFKEQGYNQDIEIIKENVKLAKQKQKQADTNRIERKSFRDFTRIENALSEYGKELINVLKSNSINYDLPEIKNKYSNKIGVIQLSDWHANELINLPHNKYDFQTLSKRAKKLIDKSVKIFKAFGIKNVLLACTGDFLNSDRRLDELLNQAVNRSKATILTVHILKQLILDLRKHFNVNIVSVLGNESRVNKEMSFADNVISDNYDFTIFAILKLLLENIEGINFGDIDKMECVVNLAGNNWLITHDFAKATNKQDQTQSTIGRYALSGITIDYIIAGHIHTARNTDISARSSSMAGSNAYNEIALNLAGRASQNIYTVDEKTRNSIVVDLQNVDGIKGYDIIDELISYNTKSIDKIKPNKTIFKIVV